MDALARTMSDPRPAHPPRSLEPLPPAVAGRPRHGLDWSPPAKYEVRRVLGTGGMGTVLLARDRNLGRLVALKVLLTQCSDYLERLRSEARLLARLEHPAIVRVHDLDVHDGRLFLAMEYVPGGSLALARLEPEPLVRSVRGIVEALAHAHRQGVVHRDIKPENILLFGEKSRVASGRSPAQLSDFGLALGPKEGSEALRRAIVGTPLTMSPEQVRGEAPGPATDQFSFGTTLYRKLTGRWPFPGRSVDDVFDAIQERDPEPLNGTPRRLGGIVLRTLEKDPADRFGSMEELGRALDRFLLSRSLFSFARNPFRRSSDSAEPRRPRIHPEDLS